MVKKEIIPTFSLNVYCPTCQTYQPTTDLTVDDDMRFQFTLTCGHVYAVEMKIINTGQQVTENMKKPKQKEAQPE